MNNKPHYSFWRTFHFSLNKPSGRMSPQSEPRLVWLPASSEHLVLVTGCAYTVDLKKWSLGIEYHCTRAGSLVSRNILLWNIKSIKSLARYWSRAISVSVAVKDNGVILEVLPGVSLLHRQCWLANAVVWLCCSWNKRMFLFSCCGSIVLLNSFGKWVMFKSCADSRCLYFFPCAALSGLKWIV